MSRVCFYLLKSYKEYTCSCWKEKLHSNRVLDCNPFISTSHPLQRPFPFSFT